jgi:hypothetical protein
MVESIFGWCSKQTISRISGFGGRS